MKVLAVSDAIDPTLYPVPDRQRFQDVSLILSCGDLAPEYLSFLVNMISAPLFYVCGNHDIRHGSKPPQGGINLHARLLSFKGLNMLGLEGSMWYNGGPYQYTESEMRRMVRGLRIGIWWQGGVDVVIAHAPPRGIYDDQDLCHQGFETFRWLIQKYKPRYFIHGHIHRFFNEPWERVTTVGETQVINAYGCHILEIDDRKSNQ